LNVYWKWNWKFIKKGFFIFQQGIHLNNNIKSHAKNNSSNTFNCQIRRSNALTYKIDNKIFGHSLCLKIQLHYKSRL
jgi:hypothetical protein